MKHAIPIYLLITSFAISPLHATQYNHRPDTLPTVIIINSFDASSLQVRKNKRELFKELTDSLQLYLAENSKRQLGLRSILIPGLIKTTDSIVHSIMVANQSTNAIVIRSLEVYFNEGAEKHTEEYGMSPKVETSYDLCSKIDYTFYTMGLTSKESQLNLCDYFTTRSVNDKAFIVKFGPDIVGKKKHTYGAVEKNAANYVSSLVSIFKAAANQ
jgi:hypothetical protein